MVLGTSVEFTLPDLFKRYDEDQSVDDVINPENLEELSAAQQKIEHGLSKFQALLIYKKITFYVLVAVWTMILWGYENQASGIVFSIPEFRKDFGHYYEGEYVLEAKWQSALSGGPNAAIAVAFIGGSWAADRFGRRKTALLASIISIPFITVLYIATTVEVFFVGKFLNGFCLGALSACLTTYVSEISPLALRGVFSGAIALALCIGPFVCVLINNTTSTYTTRMAYRAIFIPQWIFAVMSIIFQFFIPESPYWLLHKNRNKNALKELRRMYNDEQQAISQYALMKVTVDEAKLISAQSGSYIDCFKKKDLRRTALVIFSYVMQAMSGVAYVAGYSTYYFQQAGFDTQKSFQISCGAQALSISGVISSFFIIDRFGRRVLMLWGMVAITVLNLLIAATGLETSNPNAMKASSAFMAMYNYIYNIALGPVPYIVGNEISSVFLRAKTLSMGNFLNSAFQTMWGSVLPYMFNIDQANMGSKINFIFTACSFVSIIVFYLWLPETAHRSFEEIDELFALGVPARKWKGHVLDNHLVGSDPVSKPDVEFVEESKGSQSDV